MFPENRMMEILIIGALALMVLGPKELPVAMRRLGQFIGKMRGMAAEFRASFDELARQSELEELRKEVEALRSGHSSLNPLADSHVKSTADEIHQQLSQISVAPMMTGTVRADQAAAEAALVPVEPPADPVVKAPVGEAPVAAPEPAKPRAPRKPRAKAAPAAPDAEPTPPEPGPSKPAPRKSRAKAAGPAA